MVSKKIMGLTEAWVIQRTEVSVTFKAFHKVRETMKTEESSIPLSDYRELRKRRILGQKTRGKTRELT